MAHRVAPRWERAVVASSTTVAEGVRHILLDVPRSRPAPAGSHVDVIVPTGDGGQLVRSYSVVENGRQSGGCGIAVRLDPRSRGGSAFMHTLEVGETVTVSQPIQDFELTPGRERYLLLAGGIGITPLLSMAHTLAAWGADYELVYAGRSRASMAFLPDLEADHDVRLQTVVDDEDGPLDVAALVDGVGPDTELYVCGPSGMLAAVQHAWITSGRPPARLRFETFGNSGNLPTTPFIVRVPRLGLDVEVPPESTAVQALEAAGAEVMSDCLRGECGLCVVPVLAVGSGTIDHRDVFLSPRQKSAGRDICLCVSRVADGEITVEIP